MAFTNLTLETIIQEDQDALSFRIWDKSIFGGQESTVSAAKLVIKYYDYNDLLITFDDYPLIVGGVKTKFNAYLGHDGHTVNLSDLRVGNVSPGLERFPDGYYIIDLIINDGSYSAPNEPHYANNQGFEAFTRCKIRKLAIALSWPIIGDSRILSNKIQMIRMYADAAEEAIDLGKYIEFKEFMVMINVVFSEYSVNECF
jgi:hypothetical protein